MLLDGAAGLAQLGPLRNVGANRQRTRARRHDVVDGGAQTVLAAGDQPRVIARALERDCGRPPDARRCSRHDGRWLPAPPGTALHGDVLVTTSRSRLPLKTSVTHPRTA
jgi:hypothetical protein